MSRRIRDLSGGGGSGKPFRRAVLHGDLALYNLVTEATQGQVDTVEVVRVYCKTTPFYVHPNRILESNTINNVSQSGVIDFGDACESWVVGELVVAIASVHGKVILLSEPKMLELTCNRSMLCYLYRQIIIFFFLIVKIFVH